MNYLAFGKSVWKRKKGFKTSYFSFLRAIVDWEWKNFTVSSSIKITSFYVLEILLIFCPWVFTLPLWQIECLITRFYILILQLQRSILIKYRTTFQEELESIVLFWIRRKWVSLWWFSIIRQKKNLSSLCEITLILLFTFTSRCKYKLQRFLIIEIV